MRQRRIVRIVDRPTGDYCLSDDTLDYIDERGTGYSSRRAAIDRARYLGYTHYVTPAGNIRAL
jgi:hypothetical protein